MPEPHDPTPRKRPLWRRLALSLAASATLLGLLEVGLRIVGYERWVSPHPVKIWNPVKDQELQSGAGLHDFSLRQLWVPRPGARIPKEWSPEEYVNTSGYRGPVLPLERTPGVLRIATMGDSSAFGHSVPYEATWTARLEEMLDASGRETETLLAGVVGSTLRQGIERYRELVRPHRPDVLVAAFGAVNDHFPSKGGTDDAKIRAGVSVAHTYDNVLTWARAHLRSVQLAQHLVDRVDARTGVRAQGTSGADPANRKRRGDPTRVPSRKEFTGERRVGLDEFEGLLGELHRLCEEDGVALVLVSMPRRVDKEREIPVLSEYSKRVRSYAFEHNLPLFDARRQFGKRLAAGEDWETYFADAYHPNEAGHRVFAEHVLRAVQTCLEPLDSAPRPEGHGSPPERDSEGHTGGDPTPDSIPGSGDGSDD